MFTINMRQIDQIIQIYEQQAEECAASVRRFYEDIIVLARRTTYAPMVEFGNQIYRFYTEDLKSHLMHEYQDWYESPYSFHALMRAINAGENAVRLAREKMDRMGESLSRLFQLSQDEIRLDNSAPDIKNQDFEDYRQSLQACKRNLDRVTQDAESAIRSMEGDNDMVQLIGDIVKTTGVSLAESFDEMVRQVTKGEDFANSGRDFSVGSIRGQGRAADIYIPWGKNMSFL